MKKLFYSFNELLASFWFIPVLIILASVLIAMGTVYLDGILSIEPTGISRFFFVHSADSARTILSTISGAMIGVAGTVFSVTLVALTLASSQFGSRLIRNFMYVRLNQIVLGSYVSTYLYCLIVMNTINGSEDQGFIPTLSIFLAIVAAIVNILLLIVFIHRIAISIQADKVIFDISEMLTEHVTRLYPKKMQKSDYEANGNDVEKQIKKYSHQTVVHAPKNGYLQYVDKDSLVGLMSKADCLLELKSRPGDHLIEDYAMGMLYHQEKDIKNLLEKIQNQFIIGKTRTSQQDLEFSIHQMVEIAARALSPGINDPFTAMSCIDNLTSILSYLSQVDFGNKYQADEENKLRLISDMANFEGLLNASFNQIRQYSGGSPAVIIRLMEGLITIHHFAQKVSYKKAVIKHAVMVLNAGRSNIAEAHDLKDLEDRAEQIIPAG